MSKVFGIVHEQSREICIAAIRAIKFDDDLEVAIRKRSVSKTLRQLAGIHGSWVDYLVKRTGYTEDEIKHDWKARWLSGIYTQDPRGDLQEMWVERLFEITEDIRNAPRDEISDMEGVLEKHMKRLSLAWATKEQMRDFMNKVEQHYISIGEPLPVLDPEWRRWLA